MIYVTHDQVEAMTLADRIVILNNGRIEQEGSPLELYRRPANRFVAGFLGQPKMNFIPVVSDGEALRLGAGGPILLAGNYPGATELGIRPGDISISDDGNLPARVILVEPLGGSSLAHLRPEGTDLMLTVEQPGIYAVPNGTEVRLAIDADQAHIFDQSGLAIGR